MARAQESSSQAKQRAARLKVENPDFARWAKGYGIIQHSDLTQARIADMQLRLAEQGHRGGGVPFYELLYALDRVASAGMWLVVHETYARNVYLDGKTLSAEDFKPRPEGHTGGALNMVLRLRGLFGRECFDRNYPSLVNGPGALRGRHRFGQSPRQQYDARSCHSVHANRRRPDALCPRFLLLPDHR